MWDHKRRSFGNEKSQKQGKEVRKGKKNLVLTAAQ
jgi:hypothetical protein